MEVHKCAEQELCECDEIAPMYCERCEDYFCGFHIGGHLASKKCIICDIERCVEMMSEDDITCFTCWARQQFAYINAETKRLTVRALHVAVSQMVVGELSTSTT